MERLYRYNSETGVFWRLSEAGRWVRVCVGYSGYGDSKNNPTREHIRGEGPIPRGEYIIGPPRFSRNVGPIAMYLMPYGHMAHGRSALMIHGDNHTQTASRGCVILPKPVREEIGRTVTSAPDLVILEVI